MPDSVLPVFGAWWRSAGARKGNGADLPAGASSTPYDNAAVPTGGKRWSVELEYSAASPVKLVIRHNHVTAGKEVARQTEIGTYPLDAAANADRRIDFELSDTAQPNWLPSLRLLGGDVSFTSVKVYETPVNASPPVTVWDGSKEVAATVSVWDGSKEVSCTVEVFNG